MTNIGDLKTDAGIQYILSRLKDTKPTDNNTDTLIKPTLDLKNDDELIADVGIVKSASEVTKETNKEQEQEAQDLVIEDEEVENTINKDNEVIDKEVKIDTHNIEEEYTLPWFTKSDLDINNIHYIKFDESGNLEYSSIKANSEDKKLAELKVKDDFLCEIDYYKSKHYVLFVKQLESNYPFSRVFIPCDESLDRENHQEMEKVNSDNLITEVANANKYLHYVVFTDLGIANFIVKENDTIYPFGNNDLNKWFEEISNYVQINNAEYSPNKLTLGDVTKSIKDFKYDIITMHRPGVITLDSIDNQDQDYQLNIKLKDEFNFLPMNRILGCLKLYASTESKSIDTFKSFLERYFYIEV